MSRRSATPRPARAARRRGTRPRPTAEQERRRQFGVLGVGAAVVVFGSVIEHGRKFRRSAEIVAFSVVQSPTSRSTDRDPARSWPAWRRRTAGASQVTGRQADQRLQSSIVQQPSASTVVGRSSTTPAGRSWAAIRRAVSRRRPGSPVARRRSRPRPAQVTCRAGRRPTPRGRSSTPSRDRALVAGRRSWGRVRSARRVGPRSRADRLARTPMTSWLTSVVAVGAGLQLGAGADDPGADPAGPAGVDQVGVLQASDCATWASWPFQYVAHARSARSRPPRAAIVALDGTRSLAELVVGPASVVHAAVRRVLARPDPELQRSARPGLRVETAIAALVGMAICTGWRR